MKVEFEFLTTGSPFRSSSWCVTKDGVAEAYCFTKQSADAVVAMLRGEPPTAVKLEAAFSEGFRAGQFSDKRLDECWALSETADAAKGVQ